jgi:hypothetical protein
MKKSTSPSIAGEARQGVVEGRNKNDKILVCFFRSLLMGFLLFLFPLKQHRQQHRMNQRPTQVGSQKSDSYQTLG